MMTRLLVNSIIKLAKDAGEKILAIYQRAGEIQVQTKSDLTPVTEADIVAHQLITEGLEQLTPEVPILSEESAQVSFLERVNWSCYWLVDPLDGTKEFIQHNGEFVINIALIEDHKPILGVVYAPVLKNCYFAAKGFGAFKQVNENPAQPLHTRLWQGGQVTVIASRRHDLGKLRAFLARLGDYAILHVGSALKCCLVAEGIADIYPRFGITSEWDIAAAQCVLEEAGGKILDYEGNALCYNTKESLENPPFLAVGDRNYDWLRYLE